MDTSPDLVPEKDRTNFQRIEKEYVAKLSYLLSLAGQNEMLRILLDQSGCLADLRELMLMENSVQNPIALAIKDWQEYLKLWDMSDQVAELLDLSLEIKCVKPI